jgi:diguanylate cyclase (GGDEF)-like protein
VKFGITARLALVLALVGMLVSGFTGFYAFSVSRSLLVQSAQSELLTSTQVLARRLALTRQEISRNLLVLATHPAALSSLREKDPAAEQQLVTLFQLVMEANLAYFQVRLISAQDGGLEQVRVDRDNGTLLHVTGDDLQEKGHFPYVYETQKLPFGESYLSPITINHERGAHAGLERPTVQLATPVTDARGTVFGVLVINVDLNGVFTLLAADLPPDFQLFLANRNGDFLIHPDPARTFGFDKGRRFLVQQEFPETADLVTGKITKAFAQASQGAYADAPLLVSFMGRPLDVASGEDRLILGLGQPLSSVLQQTDQLGADILRIVALVCAGCLVVAVLVARAITRPINVMNTAIQRFSNDNQMMRLPVARQDEIGMLARSFAHMQNLIRRQVEDLQDSREELEHLAQHDMLTDLPNRRMFMERLEQAIARARRNDEEFALLFIDVDNFKHFNDTLGHAAGDAVLKTVAQRLAGSTRKVDTVARLGGDEFVVLLDKFSQREQIAGFTEKLLMVLKAPMPFADTPMFVEFSIGISQFPDDGTTSEAIINNADRAMYKTKAGGRNGYRFTSDTNSQSNLL